MELTSFLRDIVVIFGVALAVIAASRLLKIPAIVGFLLTGCVAGPYGLGLILNPSHVETFAELGVVFLLFETGLELSFRRLRGLGRYFFGGGSLQASSTIAVTLGVCLLFGIRPLQSFFLGLVVSLSSTAIVLRLYNERREMDAPHGSIALGILLFQDILIVPYMLIVPILDGTAQASAAQFFLRFVGGCAIMTAAFAASRFLVPRAMHYLATTRIRELFVIGSLFLCLGSALVTQRLGFSLALGAFLAGVLIAESDYRHQVMAETMPFRDVFNSMFFISIGMLLKLDFVAKHPLEVALAAVIIIAIKAVTLFLSVRALAFPTRVAATVACGLSQIGEFSFVLLQAAKARGVVDEWSYQIAIASSIVTMALTPLLMRAPPAFAIRFDRRHKGTPASPPPGTLSNHVIIVGFGLAGRHLARVLKAATIPYVIVELNGNTVKNAKREGEPILYGDASRATILSDCAVESARVVVFVISDPASLRRGVRLAHQMNPNVFIIVRTRMQADIEELRECGANEVVSEEFETSIEIFTNVLARLRIPGNIIRTQTRLLRSNGYKMLRSFSPAGMTESVAQVLSMGTTDTFLITAGLNAVDKTIVQLDLRKRTGATIIALVRDDKPQTNPSPETRLAAGDLLVLVGSHAQMDAAFGFLNSIPAATA